MQVTLLSITPDCEKLIESAGRTCYQTQDRSTPDSHQEFIKMIIRRGHFSVLEHAYATFLVEEASRAFTHQMVRHRLCAYSQKSQRYVSEKNFTYVEPEYIQNNEQAHKIFEQFMQNAKEVYLKLQQYGVRKEDARFVLPNAVTTELVISANLRQFRHIFDLRCQPEAQWEIRKICFEMLKILKQKAPSVFFDYILDPSNNTAIKVSD